jgi:hypothetical protein
MTSPDTEREFRETAAGLIQGLRALWSNSAFKVGRGRSSPATVTTEASPAATRLPITGRPIRGSAGVKVTATEYESSSWGGEPRLHDVVSDTLLRVSITSREEDKALDELRGAYSSLVTMALSHSVLARILYESRGFKHHEPEQIEALIEPDRDKAAEAVSFALIPVVEDALSDAGLEWERVREFDDWDRAAENLFGSLKELAGRTHYEYEVTAFLNGPLLDQHEPVIIGNLPNSEIVIQLSYATDASLRRGRHEGFSLGVEEFPLALRQANTTISFSAWIPIDASVDFFLSTYPYGVYHCLPVLDVLRLVHDGDIGIGALRVSPKSRYTPMIRRTYAWDFEPDAAPYLTRRMAYGEPTAIKDLYTKYSGGINQKGFDVAIRRFRESYERYQPNDPERLLDISIAFEALLLNDNVDKELSFRLSLRGARWLYIEQQERKNAFETLQQLYGIRSKIAHGASLESLKARDQAIVKRLLDSAPRLLRYALRTSIQGGGPSALDDKLLQDWWRSIELG